MTRKDYVLIAEAIKNARNSVENNLTANGLGAGNMIPAYIAEALELDNPRFDRNRFLDACGLTAHK